MEERASQRLGNYRLIGILGRGGFATVYLAQHVHLKTKAAIKVLDVALRREKVERFLAEARMIASLTNSHIIRVLDFAVDGYIPYLVMDYAPHGSLHQRHYGEKLPLSTVISYVKQIAEGLQCVHDHKLIHRDIKPSNLLLDVNNNILLSDFGISIMADSMGLPRTGACEGTIEYISPEQLQGKPCQASDLYSLGVVVYELLSGYLPFYGTPGEIAKQHIYTPPPLLREMVPEIPLAVEQVVMKSLQKHPEQRFPSVRAFATALERARKAKSIDQPSGAPSMRYHPAPRPVHAAIYRRHAQIGQYGLIARQRRPRAIPQQQRILASQKHLANPQRRALRRQW
jgi:serine/threonine protein kinase